LAAKSIATLQNEMADKKLAQEKVQADVEALSQIDEELKKTVD
jgi:hypothetical protein